MTAPVDPRPYAGPGDLVTAADVARWLHEIDDDDITGGDPMWLTISRLDARLDRERRQACRRGRWRAGARSPGATREPTAALPRRRCTALLWGAGRQITTAVGEIAVSILDLTRALAFRAAARAR